MKRYHDKHIEKQIFYPCDLVLFFTSILILFPRKLRSKPFKVTHIFQSRMVELQNDKGERFKANGLRIKSYLGRKKTI